MIPVIKLIFCVMWMSLASTQPTGFTFVSGFHLSFGQVLILDVTEFISIRNSSLNCKNWEFERRI